MCAEGPEETSMARTPGSAERETTSGSPGSEPPTTHQTTARHSMQYGNRAGGIPRSNGGLRSGEEATASRTQAGEGVWASAMRARVASERGGWTVDAGRDLDITGTPTGDLREGWGVVSTSRRSCRANRHHRASAAGPAQGDAGRTPESGRAVRQLRDGVNLRDEAPRGCCVFVDRWSARLPPQDGRLAERHQA